MKVYVARALPGPDYQLTGSLAEARERDRKHIAALKQSLQRLKIDDRRETE